MKISRKITTKVLIRLQVALFVVVGCLIGVVSVGLDLKRIRAAEQQRAKSVLDTVFEENRMAILSMNFTDLITSLELVASRLNTQTILLVTKNGKQIVVRASTASFQAFDKYKCQEKKDSLIESMISGCADLAYDFYFDEEGKHKFLSARWTSFSKDLEQKKLASIGLLLIYVVLVIVIGLAVTYILSKALVEPIEGLGDDMRALKELLEKDLKRLQFDSGPIQLIEIESLLNNYREFLAQISSLESQMKEDAARVAGAELALSLAHDIRSPVLALEMALKNESGIEKEVINNAVTRIQEISKNLLAKYKREDDSSNSRLSDSVVEIIQEKKASLGSLHVHFGFERNGLQDANCDQVVLSNLKRILSNLFNNAIEARDGKKETIVNVSVSRSRNGFVKVSVWDNGRGIDGKLLPSIGQKGFSHDKVSGNGLGVYQARKTIENWGSVLSVQSEVGVFTQIEFEVPITSVIPEAGEKILLCHRVVVVDDDLSIHSLWSKRLEAFDFDVLYFERLIDFESWMEGYGLDEQVSFLVDYELGAKINGLDLISKYGISHRSFLVTGRSRDPVVIAKSNEMSCRVIAKESINDIGIEKVDQFQSLSQKCVLIEDDELICSIWTKKAQKMGVELDVYNDISSFRKNVASYLCDTLLFMDSNLPDGKGEDFALELSQQGFKNIILTTGYVHKKAEDLPGVSKVIDKTPPW